MPGLEEIKAYVPAGLDPVRVRVAEIVTPSELRLRKDPSGLSSGLYLEAELHRHPWRERKPTGDCLSEFLALSPLRPSTVLSYARKWGILHLCGQHGYPFTLDHGCQIGEGDKTYREPLDLWFRYVDEAKAILSVAYSLQEGQPTRRMDWEKAPKEIQPDMQGADGKLLADETHRLLLWADWWMARSGMYPSLEWDAQEKRLRMVLSYPTILGLFSILAMQLLALLTSPLGMYKCSNPDCERFYSPSDSGRRPKRGQANYCPECRQSYSHSKKVYRSKKRAASSD